MTLLDIYYRAFKEYRKETADNTNCDKDRKTISQSNSDDDKLRSVKFLCKIKEDWVTAIEKGLVFVEKAVAEERQFIRTNGEVVPIEKVKKVSKDSVQHLAKHSDLITHIPDDGATLVPDELYMVERLSDYAVYENRFLYMMLSYIKNFIEYRLDKIETLRRSYKGQFGLNKEIISKKRTLKIAIYISDERTDNPFPIPDESSLTLVKRISNCREIIDALLNTDLMQQVAKTPMIKPPIVKTNVLKMNNNFKNALALYDYIASYNGLGYTYEEVKFDFAPFSADLADEIAESVNLTTFLAYKAGNGIDAFLEKEYQKEENIRKEQERQSVKERLKRLKKRAAESGKTMEEYMLLLDERNRQLERDNEELQSLRKRAEELNDTILALTDEKNELIRRSDELSATIEQQERNIADLNIKYAQDMAALTHEHEAAIAALNDEHAEQIAALNADFADKLSASVNEYEAKLSQLESSHRERLAENQLKIDELTVKINSAVSENQRIAIEYEQKLKEYETHCKMQLEVAETDCNSQLQSMRDEVKLCRGELDAMRVQHGFLTPSEDYTSRERFVELENEYEAFQTFFKKQWDLTKKEIRKTLLWTKEEKKKK